MKEKLKRRRRMKRKKQLKVSLFTVVSRIIVYRVCFGSNYASLMFIVLVGI